MITVESNKKKARIAGLLYLGVVITGILSLAYVPSKLIVLNDISLTYQNIAASQTLFRFGIISGLLCYTLFLFLPLQLYKLLSPINSTHAKIMVLLAIISVPLFFLNAQNQFSVLSLMNDTKNHFNLNAVQKQYQVMLYLEQYKNGLRIINIFSGLWLFPFGYLVFKSGFLPKISGILLITGCVGYLINFIAYTLIPDYATLGIASYVRLPASIGEIGTCLWLLIMGARDNPLLESKHS